MTPVSTEWIELAPLLDPQGDTNAEAADSIPLLLGEFPFSEDTSNPPLSRTRSQPLFLQHFAKAFTVRQKAAMARLRSSKLKHYADKLAVESEPGLTNAQLMLTNHDLKPVEPERRKWGMAS